MASSRGFSDIVNSMIERLKISQPNLDTKPGTVSRDLFIDLQADQIARFYSVLNIVSQKQSLGLAAGQDLDLMASNFGLGRKTGSPSSGFIAICSNNLSADIPIPTGTIATSRNGLTFRTLGNYTLSVADKGRLTSNANRLRKSLNLAGISTNYVLEIPVECTRIGTDGNISSLQMVTLDISFNGLTVTNLSSFTGGQNRESDDSFRSRIISVFSGANVGTSSGYRNAALATNGVQDAIVVEPGSALMLRDGTEVISTLDGSSRILNSGTGGKVDVYILGSRVEQVSESYIYNDLSGVGDATREENDHILGQQNQDLSRTIEERRLLALKNSNLPLQPVSNIISVIGSRSGELVQKFTDSSGNILGNFELIKDTSDIVGGSPFGYDKIHFISNSKVIDGELVQKSDINSIDKLNYTDISSINSVYVDISEVSDNATISKASRSTIILNHKPIVRVNRVQNLTTGEIYVVSNQNFDQTSGLNTLGEVQISGRQLPSPSDLVSVNYIWRKYFEKDIDFSISNNETVYKLSTSSDVIDWTTGNGIKKVESLLELSDDENEYILNLNNNISAIKSIWIEESETLTVTQFLINGINNLAVEIDGITINNVSSIRRTSDGLEIWNTSNANGKIVGDRVFLPSDAQISLGESVEVFYNKVELYNYEGSDGSYNLSTVTLPSRQNLEDNSLLDIVEDSFAIERPIYVSYVANIQSIISKNDLISLPIQAISGTNSLSGIGSSLGTTKQPIEFLFNGINPSDVLKYSPSQLRFNINSISSSGKIRVLGTSFNTYTFDILGTFINGRKVSITNSLSEKIGIKNIPDNYGIARIINIDYISNGITKKLDIHGYSLLNNIYDKYRSSLDLTLNNKEFIIPNINENPSRYMAGDIVRVTCQVYNTLEQEDLLFRNSGQKFTKNSFGIIDSITIASGFKNNNGILSGNIEISIFNQPIPFTNYNCNYQFLAPRNGERIQINYSVNRLILDVTNNIEFSRPVTADVLVKEAFSIPVDVSGTILVNDNFINESDTIEQNVTTAIIALLNTNILSAKVDYSDIISVAAGIRGVDSVNISLFNKSGMTGRKAFIQALENQTIIPGTIRMEAVSKDKFRIN